MKIADFIGLIAAIITIGSFLVQVVTPLDTPPIPSSAPAATAASNSPQHNTDRGTLPEKLGMLGRAVAVVGMGVADVVAEALGLLLKVAVVTFAGLVPARWAHRAFWPPYRDLIDNFAIRRSIFWARACAGVAYALTFILAFAIMFPTTSVSELFWKGIRHLAEL